MPYLNIDKDMCIGCGLCVDSCPHNSIYMDDFIAFVNNTCVLCGLCIDGCPVNAISIFKEVYNSNNIDEHKDIWIFGETHNNQLLPVVFEIASKGMELAEKLQSKVKVLIIGDKPSNIDKVCADEIYIYKMTNYEKIEENDIEIFDEIITKNKPNIILFGATSYGRSIAPRVAARFKTGLTADCTQLDINKETKILEQTRPAFGGNIMATIVCPNTRPQMATVRAGVFKTEYRINDVPPKVHEVIRGMNSSRSIEIKDEIMKHSVESVTDANIIVSVGRGIGNQKNIELAEKLANVIGGKLGVSRPIVDIGWREHNCQIGQTGYNVSPKLLIACGISGAIQHISGITNAEKIIAINTDPEAPIFKVADYCIVGDCIEIIKELIADFESREKLHY